MAQVVVKARTAAWLILGACAAPMDDTDVTTPTDDTDVAVHTDGDTDDTDPPPNVNPLGWSMVSFEPGTFSMGSPPSEPCRSSSERQHSVTLTVPFEMMVHEVRVRDFMTYASTNPTAFPDCGDDCPIDSINWWEALAYANAVSRAAGLPECYGLVGCTDELGSGLTCGRVDVIDGTTPLECRGWRLPTEAEWEYAARSGGTVTTPFPFDDSPVPDETDGCDVVTLESGRDPAQFGWTADQGRFSRPVMQLTPNAAGLHDMSGNLIEWVWDWYGDYPTQAVTDPVGPPTGELRSCRGGGHHDDLPNLRSATRFFGIPANGILMVGVRLVRSTPE